MPIEEPFRDDTELYDFASRLYDQGNYRQVLDILQPRLTQQSAPPELYSLEGAVYECLHRYSDAAASYPHALRLEPEDAYTLYRLAYVQQSLGKRKEFLHTLQRATRGEHGLYQQLASGILAMEARDFSSAIRCFQQAATLDQGSDVILWYNSALFWVKDYVGSIALLSKIPTEEQDASIKHLVGCSLQRMGDVAGARKQFEEAVQKDSTHYWAHCALAALDFKQLNFLGVLAHLKQMKFENRRPLQRFV